MKFCLLSYIMFLHTMIFEYDSFSQYKEDKTKNFEVNVGVVQLAHKFK